MSLTFSLIGFTLLGAAALLGGSATKRGGLLMLLAIWLFGMSIGWSMYRRKKGDK